jgi:hypothetical protein
MLTEVGMETLIKLGSGAGGGGGGGEAVVVLPRVAMVEPLQVQQRRRRPGFFFGYKPTRKGISWGYIIYLYILYIYAYYVYIYILYTI